MVVGPFGEWGIGWLGHSVVGVLGCWGIRWLGHLAVGEFWKSINQGCSVMDVLS